MARRRGGAQARKTGRRWHIPPPLVHGSEPLEGGEVLQEARGAEGVRLWQALRDVTLWAQTPPEARGQLFSATAGARRARGEAEVRLPEAAEAALGVLERLAGEARGPGEEEVAAACGEVGGWAEGEGRLATALGFMQAGALALPGSATAAFQVARVARTRADHARAEVWYRRAIGLARQARDWRLYSQAFRSLGNLYLLRGNLPAARRLQVRALRGARRGGMRGEQGHALHDLFCVEIAAGRTVEAETFAERAIEAYRGRNARLTALAHDIAYAWMEQGCFGRALPVFREVLPLLRSPVERLLVHSDLARAAAGTGDRQAFDDAWTAVLAELDSGRFAEAEPRALLELAHGACSLGEWSRARDAAGRALAAACLRGEGKVRFTAEALLDSANRGLLARSTAPETARAPAADALSAALLRSLQSLRAAAA